MTLFTRTDIVVELRWKVRVDDSTQYATIFAYDIAWSPLDGVYYEYNERPVATLQRKRVLGMGPPWRMFDLAGIEIGDGVIGPHTALIKLKRIAFALAATQDDEVAA